MRLKLRLYFRDEASGEEHSLGPGKAQLLEAVAAHGSISAAARSMGMAYRHAWVLIDDLNRCFGVPAVETRTGGSGRGGARLTPFGAELVRRFRAMERRARRAVTADLVALERAAPRAGRRSRPHPG
jgi:molybdate transport system regulatory protein